MLRRPLSDLARRLAASVACVALATQPLGADAAFYYRNVGQNEPATGPGTTTPPPPNPATNAPVRGSGSLSVFAATSARARPGVPFAMQAYAQGPSGPVRWQVTGGSLPQGIALDPYVGTLSGTPSDADVGTYAGIVIQGTDSAGYYGTTQPIAVQVAPRPSVTVAASTAVATGQAVSIVPQVASALGSQSWSISGSLPSGLSFDAATGTISGSTLQGGTVGGLALTVVDSDGARGTSAPFSIAVTSPLVISGLNPSYGARLNRVAQTIQPSVAGASGQVTWSLASGTLPPGMFLDAGAGTVSGTPGQAGKYANISLKATDASGAAVVSAPFSVTVGTAPVVNLSPLSYSARNGTAIAVKPSADGVVGTPRWILNGGTLPAGLSFNIGTGTISGTPTATAQLSGLTLTVVDLQDGSSSTSQPFSISTLAGVKLASVGPASAEVGQPFTMQAPAASNLAGTPAWSVSGALPAGLTVNPATGTISGTPTAATSSPATVRFTVTDGFDGAAASGNDFPFYVAAKGTFSVGTLSPSYSAFTGQAFRLSPALLGAKPPAVWVPSALPSWAAFDNSTGTISGTPASPEPSMTVQLTAQDASGRSASSTPFSISTAAGLALSYGPGAAAPGQPFTLYPSVSGARGTPSFSLSSGTLPDGLGLDVATGRISGTTFAAGTYPLSVTVNDGSTSVRSNTFAVTVPASAYSASIPAKAAGQPFVPFSAQATASGFQGQVTWSVGSGTLPAWASLNAATGLVSGMPDAAGYAGPLTLQAADASGNVARTNPFTILVAQAPALSASMQPISVSLGSSVSAAPVATNTQGTPTWAVTAGTLPGGLSFNASTGAITGTPAAVGTTSGLVLAVTDASGASASTSPFSVTVSPAAQLSATLGATALSGTLGQLFASAPPTVSNARGGYTVALASGTLPAWATLDAATGAVSGTPTGGASIGTVSGLVLAVTDGEGRTVRTPAFSIQVSRVPLTASNATGFATHPGIAYAGTAPTASNAIGAVSWTVAPALPAGLSLNASTGAISGSVAAGTAAGVSTYVLTATDAFDGSTAQSNGFTVEVYGTPAITLPGVLSMRYGVYGELRPSVSSAPQPVRWRLASGTLPKGLALDASSGSITGTPQALGTTSGISLGVTDAQGFTGTSAPFAITVDNSIHVSFAAVPYPGPAKRVTVAWTSPAPVVAGAIGDLTYALASGAVAPGMSFSTKTGQVSGTATAAFSGSVTIQATDSTGQTATSAPLDVSMVAAPSIVQADIATRVGAPVSVIPAVSNVAVNPFTLTYSLTLNGGTLPAGLALGYPKDSTTYAIQGTPTATGAVSGLVLKASDADGAVGSSQPFSVTVTPGITISGIQPQPYSGRVGYAFATPVQPSVGNSKGTVTWALSRIPGGLTFDPASGRLSGTPSEAYTGPVTLRATDASDGATTTTNVNLAIAPAIQVLNVADLTTHVGMDISSPAPSVVDRGGSTWTFTATGTALPAFATLNGSTGILSLHAPTAGSTSGIRIQAANNADQATGVSAPFAVNVVPMPAVSGVSTSYTARLGFPFKAVAPTLSNAIGAVAWSVGGQLPSWARVDPASGVISGTPSGTGVTGTTPGLTLVGTDSTTASGSSTGFSIGVYALPAISLATTSASGQLRVGDTYTLTPSVTGIAGSASWTTSFASGTSLPPGLGLDGTSGKVSGNVTGPGSATFTLVVTDSADGSTSSSASTALVANPALTMAALPDVTVHANQTYVTTPANPASGTVGTPAYALTPGNVPPGMNPFDTVKGVLSGIPTAEGTQTYTIKVTDPVDGRTATSSFNLSVVGALAFATQPTDVTSTPGTAVNVKPTVQNALGTVSYALLQNGSPAPGALSSCSNLSFSTTNGSITGTPTATCSVPGLSVSAVDSSQTATSNQFAVTVAAPLVTLDPNAVPMAFQEGGTGQVRATTNLPNPTWTLANAPAGSSVDGNGLATIYGGDVPSDANSTVTVKATSGAYSDSKTFALTVKAATAQFSSTQFQLRSGTAFGSTGAAPTVATNMAAAGAWTIASSPSDVAGLAVSGSNVSGTAPAVTGANAVTRALTATYTASGAPQGATPGAAVANATLTVYPALGFASSPVAASFVPGVNSTVAAPNLNGKVGTVAYALMQGTTNVTSTLSTSCPGLSFSTASGAISGTSTRNCSLPGLTLVASDAGNGGSIPASTATSGSFDLNSATTLAFTTQPTSQNVISGASATITGKVAGTPYGAITWSVADGSGTAAPSWLSPTACTGTSTTCTITAQTNSSIAAGTYPATGAYYLKATDAAGTVATSTGFVVNVQVSPVTASVATSSYNGVIGLSTTTGAVTASGGATPYTYTLTTVSGTKPTTVGAFNADGSFSFTPNAAGTWVYNVKVTSGTDTSNNATTGNVTVTMAAPTASAGSSQTFTPGTAVTVSLTTNLPNPTWSLVSGTLPPWLSGLPTTGSSLTGVAANVASSTPYTFVLKATSGSASQNAASVTLTNSAPTATLGATSVGGTASTAVRSGQTVTAAVTTNLGGTVSWTGAAKTTANAAVTDTAFGSVTGSTATFTATNGSNASYQRNLTVTATTTATPSSGSPGTATSAAQTITVYPSLGASVPTTQMLFPVGTSTSFSPNSQGIINSAGGSWKLMYPVNGTPTDISASLGSYCAGLSYSTSTGTVSGSATGTCAMAGLYHVLTDAANNVTANKATVDTSSTPFSINAAVYGQAFLFTKVGTTSFTLPQAGLNVRILIVGGGGGGQLAPNANNAPGTASGLVTYQAIPNAPASISITVGAGGGSASTGNWGYVSPGGTSSVTVSGTTYTAAGSGGVNGGSGAGAGGSTTAGGTGGASSNGGTGQGTTSPGWSSFGNFKSAVVTAGAGATWNWPASYASGGGHKGGCGGGGVNFANVAFASGQPVINSTGGGGGSGDISCGGSTGFGGGASSSSNGSNYNATYYSSGGAQGAVLVEWDAP